MADIEAIPDDDEHAADAPSASTPGASTPAAPVIDVPVQAVDAPAAKAAQAAPIAQIPTRAKAQATNAMPVATASPGAGRIGAARYRLMDGFSMSPFDFKDSNTRELWIHVIVVVGFVALCWFLLNTEN